MELLSAVFLPPRLVERFSVAYFQVSARTNRPAPRRAWPRVVARDEAVSANMQTLPPFVVGQTTFALPLFPATSQGLAAVFLGEGAGLQQRLAEQLAVDASLALWTQCQSCLQGGAELRSFSAMADWLLAHARQLFSGAVGEAFPSAQQAEHLAVESVWLAALVAVQTARNPGCGTSDGTHSAFPPDMELQLVALVHNAAAWLRLAARGGQCDADSLLALPGWLRRRIGVLRASTSAVTAESSRRSDAVGRDRDTGAALRPSAAATVQALLQPKMQLAWPLNLLARRMERLARLEHRFALALREEKLASLAEFAAGAGHEINNPLAVIAGRSQLLLASERHPQRRHDLATIHAQARRVHEMILDLMLFARPPRPSFQQVDVRSIVEELARERAETLRRRRIELTTHFEDGLPAVEADPTQLAVALAAAFDNAIQTLDQGGHIQVSAQRRVDQNDAQLVIRIADNGPGMDEPTLRHCFDPFFSGRAAGRGLGMGMAKCWRILDLHDGSVDVDSKPRQGTTVSLVLPLRRRQLAATVGLEDGPGNTLSRGSAASNGPLAA
jgi:hypothetical protein